MKYFILFPEVYPPFGSPHAVISTANNAAQAHTHIYIQKKKEKAKSEKDRERERYSQTVRQMAFALARL